MSRSRYCINTAGLELKYYSTDYNNPLTSGAVSALNQVIAATHAFGGSVADASSVEVGPRCSPRPTGTGETVDPTPSWTDSVLRRS